MEGSVLRIKHKDDTEQRFTVDVFASEWKQAIDNNIFAVGKVILSLPFLNVLFTFF